MPSQTILLLAGAYLFICFLIAAECGNREWSVGSVFVMCALISPLIGAILYTTYKKDGTIATESPEVKVSQDDPALKNLIDKIEKK